MYYFLTISQLCYVNGNSIQNRAHDWREGPKQMSSIFIQQLDCFPFCTPNHICSDQGSVRPLAVSNSQGVLYFFNLHRGVWRAFQLFFTSGHREFWVCVCVPLSTYQYVFLIRYLLPRQGNDYVFKLSLTYKWRK